MKEGRVVVEDVAILEEPVYPAPYDVQVLRLVGVDPIVKEVHQPEDHCGHKESSSDLRFGRGRIVAEIAASKGRRVRGARFTLFGDGRHRDGTCHVSPAASRRVWRRGGPCPVRSRTITVGSLAPFAML